MLTAGQTEVTLSRRPATSVSPSSATHANMQAFAPVNSARLCYKVSGPADAPAILLFSGAYCGLEMVRCFGNSSVSGAYADVDQLSAHALDCPLFNSSSTTQCPCL